jgi:type I restriction enzyme R subunit
MIEKNYLNADQVNFMRTIETVFSKKHHIEYSDLFELPFTNISPNPVQLLPKNDLDEVLSLCKTLEVEVFTHA